MKPLLIVMVVVVVVLVAVPLRIILTKVDRNKRKELIRKFGTTGINRYVHNHCKEKLLEHIRKEGTVTEPGGDKSWKTNELLGRYPDIDHCDMCGLEFKPSDEGYYSCCVLSPEELKLREEVKKEKKVGG